MEEQDKEIVIPKEIECNIEFELNEIMWIKCLDFIIHSFQIPKKYLE